MAFHGFSRSMHGDTQKRIIDVNVLEKGVKNKFKCVCLEEYEEYIDDQKMNEKC